MSDFKTVVEHRRSVRAFEPVEMSRAEIEAVLETAKQSPSAVNAQPWLVHIVQGETMRKISAAMAYKLHKGELNPDFSYDQSLFTGVYEDRYRDAYRRLYEAFGVAREDKEGRQRFMEQNLYFYGAKQAAFVFVPDTGDNVNVAMDAGMFIQTFMLALDDAGYGSVPQLFCAFFPDDVREILGVPANHKLLLGISFGKPDLSANVNSVRTPRADLSEIVTFHS
ncbi:nitroreductase [Neisseria perflava]|uniref:nitroreductase n=1 Tax=Neisseria perflava TaxID=33053 RepID=UPI0020A0D380|nr:nitroreductase [Neisseria perflava]MCP1660541.1 nitroreductase [Neisseria perflava]MCP1772691.1 nitroreductase [Neisseria perflava]